MRLISVAAAALNQTPLDWEGNAKRILSAIESARADSVRLLCLPELSITGYGCEDAFLMPEVAERALSMLVRIEKASHGLVVGVGLPLYVGPDLYNAVACVADGVTVGFILKQFLARDGVHYEPRWFRAWPGGTVTTVQVGDREVPAGDLLVELRDGRGKSCRVGFEICEDAWAPRRPGASLAARGVEVILNPSASHFGFGKSEIRRRFVLEGSRAFGAAYLYANLVGNEAGRIIYDGSCLIASGGDVVAQGPRFSFREVVYSAATIDLDRSITQRPRSADRTVLEGNQREGTLGAPADGCSPKSSDIVAVAVSFAVGEASVPRLAAGSLGAKDPLPEAWERSISTSKKFSYEEFSRAMALGLFDYHRKSGSRGFVISLSGGADSASLACLVRLMVHFGVKELGLPVFVERLSGGQSEFRERLRESAHEGALMSKLLQCVYQASAHSSQVTRAAAKGVAEAVQATFQEWNIASLVNEYEKLVTTATSTELSWQQDDLARQNIQARVRAPGVWMLANLAGALLLATSNRSEAVVGYTTMDGDSAGGLCPLAGIDKHFLRQWLVWLETTGPEGAASMPALHAVNVQAPTAELRPLKEHQTDEADLMPYELLEKIERLALVERKAPREVYEILSAAGSNGGDSALLAAVEKFFRLFSLSQWKRERFAPGFHVDVHNVDPRSWLRFPILSGGFAAELKELRASVVKDSRKV